MAALYSSIVLLMQDLELLLSSYHHILQSTQDCSRPCPFTKEDIQILYNRVSLMDSLLRDPSGESYNSEIVYSFGNRIIEVVYRAERYVGLRLFGYLEDPKTIRPTGINLPGNRATVVELSDAQKRAFKKKKSERNRYTQGRELLIDENWQKRSIELGEDAPSPDSKELQEINEEICSINNELKRLKLNHDVGEVGPSNDSEVCSTSSASGGSCCPVNPLQMYPNNGGKLVGLERELVMMLDRLTGLPLQLNVLAAIGMGGIGKTSFARRLYDDPLVMHHFYLCAWVTVSQNFQLREILLIILRSVAQESDEIYEMSIEQLRDRVYKSLKYRRYLIVLDDLWDEKAWDDLKRTFPDDKNGSRIILTSRLKYVGIHASPDTPPYIMRCLTLDESWELLSLKLFGNDSCPVQLVTVGKEIARKCQGLPLAITVVGGILSKMKLTLEVWEEVAERVGSLVMEDPHYCQNILALSYRNLSDQLKSCFLYMGVFPEDYEISAKKLIWLWISEGFIRPWKQQSLEEMGEHYLEELISRSLVFVKAKGANGRTKTCYIHDLVRELCLSESRKENFLSIINSSGRVPETDRHNPRCLSVHSNIREYMRPRASFPFTHSFFCFETIRSTDLKHCDGITFKLLKVLDIAHIHRVIIPLGLIHLRYLVLAIRNTSMMIEILRKLIFLQTFITYCEWDGLLPWNIFDLKELRHFYMKRSSQSYWSDVDGKGFLSGSKRSSSPFGKLQNVEKLKPGGGLSELFTIGIQPIILPNLQTVSSIRPIECTRETFLKMPNLKKLGIHETEEDYFFRGWINNLVYLQELETLKYTFYNPFVSAKMKPCRLPSLKFFPPKLMKLTLSGTSFPWEDMSKLALLPKLEVLKLRNYAFSGVVWRTEGGGFSHLKFLLISSTNLEYWESNGAHFPSLQHLISRHCILLKALPDGLGEAPLLEKIEIHCCAESASTSAREIQEEQSLGNDCLAVCITHR